ncbi:ribosome binding protein [Babesia ovata]|uniref:Ribosome binding protein n=1 Tax=Babesia ovata TaxID=189622 RepID=A0A2H6KHX8_9APIC|nr:ribosome binding protein [Babesia ovata]GBE62602.1 ribosome binding protein [Babesia ovata]
MVSRAVRRLRLQNRDLGRRLRPGPPRPALPSGAYRASGGRTSGPRPFGSRSSVGSHGSGVRAGGARGMGANHRGGIHSRGGGPGAQRDRGGPGPRGAVGAPGARGTQRSSSPGHTMSTQSQPLQSQDDLQSGSQQPLPAVSSAPSSTSQPGAPGPTSSGSDVSGQQSGTSQDAARTQPPSAPRPGSGSPGVHGTGQPSGDNGSQQVNKDTDQTPSGVTTAPVTTAAGGGGGRSPQDPPNNINKCSDGVSINLGGSEFCQRKPKMPYRPLPADLFTKLNDIGPRNYSPKPPIKRITSPAPSPRRLPSQPSHPAPVPPRQLTGGRGGQGRPPVDPRGRDAGEGDKAYVLTMPMPEVTGKSLVNKTSEKKERLHRKQRKTVAEQKMAEVQKNIYERHNRHSLLNGSPAANAQGLPGAMAPQVFTFAGYPLETIKEKHSGRYDPTPPRKAPTKAKHGYPTGIVVPKSNFSPVIRSDVQGVVLPQIPGSKTQSPQHKFKQADKPIVVETLHGHPHATMMDVSITDLTKPTGNDIPVPEPQKMDIPVPPSLAEGSVIPDPNLLKSGSSIPSATLDTPLPPVHIEVNKLTTPEGVLKSDITQAPSLPTVHFIDAALPNNAYQEMDSSDPSVWGNFKNYGFDIFPETGVCRNPWYVADASTTTITPTPSPPPGSDQLPPPNTIREMLHWLVGFSQYGHIPFIADHLKDILKEFNKDASQLSDALEVTGDPTQLTASHVSNTLTQACLYAATVLHKMKYKNSKDAPTTLNFKSVYCHLRYSTDPACLLCQLRDYAYACYHQLAFLKSQCSRTTKDGGWQDCKYGSDIKMPSPLQAFLTDASDSKFETHPFDPCDICLKSRVNMGFTKEDLPASHQTGKHLHTILSPTCGGEDPLLTLSSQLNCITRRTPRTAGEIVSFFHNFGNELHSSSSQLSRLGTSLTDQHNDCPRWDCLKESDADTVRDLRGSDASNSIHDHNHDKGHPKTLSTLLGCDITNAQCPQLLSPITYRAYALYSPSFVHHYLSWTVYLPDRLWDSLLRLHHDLEKLQCHDSKSEALHQCDKALPLLYSHGFTPPDGTLQSSLTCSKVIAKLEAVVSGKPIARLMTAMDTFLYRIRAPFLYTVFTLWLIATLYILHSLLYRMDVMRIRSHLLTTRASHLIDVKALLAGSRRMLSLYKDVDYFDDDFHS